MTIFRIFSTGPDSELPVEGNDDGPVGMQGEGDSFSLGIEQVREERLARSSDRKTVPAPTGPVSRVVSSVAAPVTVFVFCSDPFSSNLVHSFWNKTTWPGKGGGGEVGRDAPGLKYPVILPETRGDFWSFSIAQDDAEQWFALWVWVCVSCMCVRKKKKK